MDWVNALSDPRWKERKKWKGYKRLGKSTLDEDTEDCLKKCISIVYNYGFSPSMNEVQVK